MIISILLSITTFFAKPIQANGVSIIDKGACKEYRFPNAVIKVCKNGNVVIDNGGSVSHFGRNGISNFFDDDSDDEEKEEAVRQPPKKRKKEVVPEAKQVEEIPGIHPRTTTYYKEFLTLCKKYHRWDCIRYSENRLKTIYFTHSSNVRTICGSITEACTEGTFIVLDARHLRGSESSLRRLLFHELGHALLDNGHTNNAGFASIMRPTIREYNLSEACERQAVEYLFSRVNWKIENPPACNGEVSE